MRTFRCVVLRLLLPVLFLPYLTFVFVECAQLHAVNFVTRVELNPSTEKLKIIRFYSMG